MRRGERPVTTVMITNNVEEAILLADRIVPIVAGPPATLGAPIPVALARPRTLAQLAHDEQARRARARRRGAHRVAPAARASVGSGRTPALSDSDASPSRPRARRSKEAEP